MTTTATVSRGCDSEAELTLEPAPNAVVAPMPGGRLLEWTCLTCPAKGLPRSSLSSAVEGAVNHVRSQHPHTGEHVEVRS